MSGDGPVRTPAPTGGVTNHPGVLGGRFVGGACGESLHRHSAVPLPLAREAMARSAGGGWPGTVGVDRAGAQYPQGVRRIRKRQSRQRLRCVRPYTRYTEAFRLTGDGATYGDLCNNNIAGKHGGICRTMPAKQPSSFGGKSWRGWQSGSGGLS